MQEVSSVLARLATEDTTPTLVPGLTLHRVYSGRPVGLPLLYSPMVCFLAQGEKRVALGDRVFRYSEIII